MNKKYLIAGLLIAAAAAGYLAGRTGGDVAEPAATDNEDDKILYWVAPMDPNYRRDEPGKSPMGMDLVPVYADELDAGPGVVKIDPTVVNNLGVRTETAERGPLARIINTVGYVAYDEDTLQHVHSRVDGWIENLVTKAAGDRVEKGQLLFEFYSPTLVNAQEEFLAALRSGSASLERASRDRLAAFGVSVNDIAILEKSGVARQRMPVYAPAGGVIANLGVREGIFITPNTEVMSIAKLDRVWVLAEVFERQLAWVAPGQRAEVTLDYLPGKRLIGSIDYVYPELDPVTRTLKVRLRFDNPDELLRPNMFATVKIDGQGVGNIVHVSKQAIIRGGSVDRIVVDMGDGRYQSRPVLLGIESGDRIAIRRGLRAGERVVTSAQFLIDSESNIDSALQRLNRGDEEPGR